MWQMCHLAHNPTSPQVRQLSLYDVLQSNCSSNTSDVSLFYASLKVLIHQMRITVGKQALLDNLTNINY